MEKKNINWGEKTRLIKINGRVLKIAESDEKKEKKKKEKL